MNPIVSTYALTAIVYIVNEVIIKNTKRKVGEDLWTEMPIDKQIIACVTYASETVTAVRDNVKEIDKPKES